MGRTRSIGRRITTCAAPGRNGGKSIFSIAHPPAAPEVRATIPSVPPDWRSKAAGRVLVKATVAPALAGTSDILVPDRRDRACDLGLCRISQFDDRQAGSGRYEAEQTQGIFHGGRGLLYERGSQRRQPALQISRGLQPAAPAAFENDLTQIRRDIRNHRYATVPAGGHEGERGDVLSRQQPKAGRHK